MRNTYNNVVIEVSLDPVHLLRIKDLVNSPMLKNAKNVHIVNVFDKCQANFLPISIDKKDLESVEEFVSSILEDLKEELLPTGADSENWIVHSFFSSDSKIKSREYLRQIKADLVITSTRGEQNTSGLFCDSFSYYLVSNAPCDVYVLKKEGHVGNLSA